MQKEEEINGETVYKTSLEHCSSIGYFTKYFVCFISHNSISYSFVIFALIEQIVRFQISDFMFFRSMQDVITTKLSSNQVYLGQLKIEDSHLLQISSKHAYSIKQLWLSIIQGYKVNNRVTYVGIYYISLMPWNNLTKLGIWNNKIGCKGCKFITNMELHSLQYLNISNHINNIDENLIENAGISHLVKLQSKKLKYLDLSKNFVGINSIKVLVKGNWKELRQISLWENKLKMKEDILDLVLLQIKGIKSITISLKQNEIDYNYFIYPIKSGAQSKRLIRQLQQKFGYQQVSL